MKDERTSNLDLRHANSIFLQACLRSWVLSVNWGLDFFGRFVLVETGTTELRRETSTELTLLVNFSTGFVTIAIQDPRQFFIECHNDCRADMRSKNIFDTGRG